mgnify:CR=1 FL=1
MKVCGVYEIVNLSTGERYVGSAQNVQGRFDHHRTLLRYGRHHSPGLQNAFWGGCNLAFNVLSTCRPCELIAQEQAEIDRGATYNTESSAKLSGRKASQATRKKISAANLGGCLTAEHRAKLSESNRNRKFTPEMRATLSAAQQKRFSDPEAREQISKATRAAMQTPEMRAKLSAAAKRRWASPESAVSRAAVAAANKKRSKT